MIFIKRLILLLVFFIVLNNNAKEMRIGYLSTWNIECGIAMYTKHHLDAIEKTENKCFVYDFKLPSFKILNRIVENKLDILNIQYTAGILHQTFGNKIENLIDFIYKVKSKNIKLVVTFHEEVPFLTEIIALHADFCIFHKNPVYITKTCKYKVLPMGIPVFQPNNTKEDLRKKYNFMNDEKILTTIGFILNWKKIPEILELIIIYLKKK